MAAVEGLVLADAATFASLPLPLAQRIFLALLVDERARASCVCRAWRDTMAVPALWTRLTVSVRVVSGGGEWHAEEKRFLAVLRARSARRAGPLTAWHRAEKPAAGADRQRRQPVQASLGLRCCSLLDTTTTTVSARPSRRFSPPRRGCRS